MSVVAPEKTVDVADDSQGTGIKFSHAVTLIIAGIFITGIAQPHIIGYLPFAKILQRDLHASRTQFSAFFFFCAFPWYLKPFAGMLSDAFPLFGTRRRSYLLVSSILAALSWTAVAFVPHQFGPLLTACIIVNLFLMFASTVIGAVLVETSRSKQASGRLASVRMVTQNAIGISQGYLGGILTSLGVITMAGASAGVVTVLFPISFLLLRENKVVTRMVSAHGDLSNQVRTLATSRGLWIAALITALFFFAPGFTDVQYYRQTQQFELSSQNIGSLMSISAACGFISVLAYALLCQRASLRMLIVCSILLNSLGNFLYLLYSRNLLWDAVIEAQNGALVAMCELALYDLAARSVPKGCEAMGYGLLIAIQALFFKSATIFGSWLTDNHLEFWKLVAINSGTTLCVLLLVPLLPYAIKVAKDRPTQAASA